MDTVITSTFTFILRGVSEQPTLYVNKSLRRGFNTPTLGNEKAHTGLSCSRIYLATTSNEKFGSFHDRAV